MAQLVQAEQSQAEGAEALGLITHQRHAAGGLQTGGHEFAATAHIGVGGVADNHAGRLVALCRNAGKSPVFEQGPHFAAQFDLALARGLEPVLACFQHRIAQEQQTVRGHGGVVGMLAFDVAFGNHQPFFEVAGKAAAGGGVHGVAGAFAQTYHGGARRAAPAFLRSADEDVHIAITHAHPHGAAGDAVQHEQCAHIVRGGGNLFQIGVGQHNATGCFHMRRKHQCGFFAADGFDHFVDGGRRPGRLGISAGGTGLADNDLTGDAAGFENLAPAVAEKSVAQDQHFLVLSELARHRFHAIGAAAGNDGRCVGFIHLAQHAQNVLHGGDEFFRHVVEGTVGINHRKFEQTIRIDIGQQAGHGETPLGMRKRETIIRSAHDQSDASPMVSLFPGVDGARAPSIKRPDGWAGKCQTVFYKTCLCGCCFCPTF